jgi:hypothetical protein
MYVSFLHAMLGGHGLILINAYINLCKKKQQHLILRMYKTDNYYSMSVKCMHNFNAFYVDTKIPFYCWIAHTHP